MAEWAAQTWAAQPALAAWTSWLLTYLLHSSALIGAAWAVTRATRLRPTTRDVLWKTALVAGLVTATASSLRPASISITVSAPVADPSPACRAAIDAGAPGGPAWLRGVEGACAHQGSSWPIGFLGLWLAGAGLGLTVLASRLRRLSDLRRSLRSPGSRALRLLEELTADADSGSPLARARLRSSGCVHAPCVLPGSMIVLSEQCEGALTDAELRAVLAHELAHLSRRDVAWSGLSRLLSVVFWIQPLNRIVAKRLSEVSELICDDWAVRRTGEGYALASAISRVAERVWPAPSIAMGVSMAGREGRRLGERVRRILSPAEGRRESRWFAASMAALMVVPLHWLPAVAAPAARATFVVEAIQVLHTGPDVPALLRPDDSYGVPDGAPVAVRRVVVARTTSD